MSENTKNKSEKFYKVGQRFRVWDTIYLLSIPEAKKICLINVYSGMGWSKPYEIPSEISNFKIPAEYFNKMVGEKWEEFSLIE